MMSWSRMWMVTVLAMTGGGGLGGCQAPTSVAQGDEPHSASSRALSAEAFRHEVDAGDFDAGESEAIAARPVDVQELGPDGGAWEVAARVADPEENAIDVDVVESLRASAHLEVLQGLISANEVVVGTVIERRSAVDFEVIDGIPYADSHARAVVEVTGVLKGRASVGEFVQVEFKDNSENDPLWLGSHLLVLLEPWKGDVRQLARSQTKTWFRRCWKVLEDGVINRTGRHVAEAADLAALEIRGEVR